MTFLEFKKIVQKQEGEPYWLARLITRHLSAMFSWIFIKLGISANVVTIISLIIGLIGAFLFGFYNWLSFQFAYLALLTWYILDYSDGEVARYAIAVERKTPNFSGEYLDALVHKWVQPLTHVCLGIALAREFNSFIYVYLGLLASASYVGWTRTTATSILYKAIVTKEIDSNKNGLTVLADLGNLKPDYSNKSKLKKIVEQGKSIKLLFSYPGFMIFLGLAGICEYKFNGILSFIAWKTNITPITFYLIITSVVGISQNLFGTWYISKILKTIKR